MPAGNLALSWSLRLPLLLEIMCILPFLLEPPVQEEMPPLEGEGEDDDVRMEEVD